MMRPANEPTLVKASTVAPVSNDPVPFLGVAKILRELGGPKQPFAMLLLEIGHQVDQLGDPSGERLMQLAAHRARRVVGDCVVARLGARRLVVLLEGPIDEIAALAITGRLHESLRAPFDVDHEEIFILTSVGIGLGEWNEEPSTVLRHSERALERVKMNGGDATAVEPTQHLYEIARDDAA